MAFFGDKMPTQAKTVEAAIKKHYQYDGKYNPPQSDDIKKHLMSNRIDHCENSPEKHSGFDRSFDGSLMIVHYSDNSVLIITTSNINAPM